MKKVSLFWILLSWIALNAGAFYVDNVSSSIESHTYYTAARYDWAKEYRDVGDLDPMPYPQFFTRLLEVYSEPYEGRQLAIDARPKTSITPMILSLRLVGQTVAQAENRLLFEVDAQAQQDFQYRMIRARQIWPAIGDWHTIPKDGSVYNIQLPDLVNQPAGVYAKWEVTVDRILPGDLVEDGVVDLQDFALLAAEWMMASSETENGGNYCISDTDLSRLTDIEDLLDIAESWLTPE